MNSELTETGSVISTYLSNKITHVMAIMMLFIVYIHFHNCSFLLSSANATDIKMWERIIDFVSQGISRVAVPTFFMISGYLAFSKRDISTKQLMKGFLKRLKTLGLTYILWNVILCVFHVLSTGVSNYIKTGLIQFDFDWTVINIFNVIFNHQYNFAFWYVQQLLILSLVSVVLYYVLKSKWSGMLTVAIFYLIYLNVLELDQYVIISLLFPGLLFYSVGAIIALHYKDAVSKPLEHNISLIFAAGFILLLLYRLIIADLSVSISIARTWITYKLYESLIPICFWYAFDVFEIGSYHVMDFEKNSFMVYATQNIFISIITSSTVSMLLGLKSESLMQSISLYIVIPIIITITIMLITVVLKKRFPRVISVLTGGR